MVQELDFRSGFRGWSPFDRWIESISTRARSLCKSHCGCSWKDSRRRSKLRINDIFSTPFLIIRYLCRCPHEKQEYHGWKATTIYIQSFVKYLMFCWKMKFCNVLRVSEVKSHIMSSRNQGRWKGGCCVRKKLRIHSLFFSRKLIICPRFKLGSDILPRVRDHLAAESSRLQKNEFLKWKPKYSWLPC